MSNELEFYKHIFHSNNIKLTTKRTMILKIFFNHRNEHLTAKEIYYLVKKNCPSIGLATVYRTIQTLFKLDLLDHLLLEDGVSRYKLFLDKDINFKVHNKQHPHLICLNCKKILDCHPSLMATIENRINKFFLFKVTNSEMKFYGYCQECCIKKSK
ncbi:transcriptional repressor [Clostridium sporogenes]|uniref:Transcriptional repressor n=1 Tax=Clostridium botulinum TaxID=1491 RepID=A0A6M0T230_CLOBO|nr:Fur family transcriptional regulator [Clostridium sporogenes]NFA61584.1 transcriptional repressor [Clostridium botulinum]NFI73824.1 transcriptional repressor [Clostridium sporogenes]NFL71636.1 transcriptional repressor [Clostridium sporogenes]NFM24148.1 transcriptional repressor [Clostridium sporogenes]NFP61698.1 transcriptional repressor [Clostridium sporogenes]